MKRRRGLRGAARLVGRALTAAAVVGCAGGAARGGAGDAAPPPRVVPAPPPSGARPHGLPSPEAVEPLRRAWRPLGIRWTPAAPEEGTAVGVQLFQPVAGRRVAAVEGELDGRPVRFAPAGSGWFGVAPIPIAASGRLELVLRISLAPDSSLEQRATIDVRPRSFPATQLSVEPRFTSPPPETLARIEAERARVLETIGHLTHEWLLDGSFQAPRPGRVTSPFGQRRLYNGELRSRHMGVDLPGAVGEPVRAAARGRVALADELYYAGRAVYLDHGLGVYTAYFHLSRIRVAEGEIVEAGEVLGDVGTTGRVTGAHLHWSLYVAGQSVDAGSLLGIEVPPRLGK